MFYDFRSLKAIKDDERGIKGQRGSYNIVLFYPNSYNIGISSLAFHRIWELTRRAGEIGALRCFLEGRNEKQILYLDGQLTNNDVKAYAFFLSYEIDYINVIHALNLLNIPVLSRDRKEYPLIIGGGVAVTDNPEPLADVFDIIFIGEAEESYRKFLEVLKQSLNRDELIDLVKNIEGIYVPSTITFEYNEDGYIESIKGKKIKRGIYKDFPNDFSKSLCTTLRGEFGQTFLIELTRGCPCRCKFCISRTIYSPVRFAKTNNVIEVIKDAKDAKKIGLLGASVSYHPGIKDIMEFVLSEGKEFSLSSLRADKIDRDFVALLKKGGTKTITIAPEAGSEKLRSRIEKGVSNADIENAVKLSLSGEIEGIKLYFMVGLPLETWEDVDAIIDMAGLIKHIENTEKKRFKKVIFTLSPFVPKPFTPLQWASFEGVETIMTKINFLRKKLSSRGIIVHYDLPRWARMQTILSRGDRKVLNILLKGIKNTNINPTFYAERERNKNEIFPWEVVDAMIDKAILYQQWLNYKEGSTVK